MKTLTFKNIRIEIQFNEPVEETSYTAEDFDMFNKPAYATIGAIELMNAPSDTMAQLIIGQIFKAFYQVGQVQKLDYLQKLTINEVEVWCIDNGSTICLLTKEEY